MKNQWHIEIVEPHPVGGWKLRRGGHLQAHSYEANRAVAIEVAEQTVIVAGGGEVRVMNAVGKVETRIDV